MMRTAKGSARRGRTRKERARLKREFRARMRKGRIVAALTFSYYISLTVCLQWFPHGALSALAMVLLYLLPVYPLIDFAIRNHRCPRCERTWFGTSQSLLSSWSYLSPPSRPWPAICPHCGADFR